MSDINTRIIQPTAFGSVAVIWTEVDRNPKVVRVLVSKPGSPAEDRVAELHPDSQPCSCPEIDDLASGIEGLLEGQAIDFSLALAKLDLCGAFQQCVLRAEHAIPRGSVSTYQRIAAHLGKPNGARAVGNALARNPFPLIVPCHRAIRSNRHLGGYQGGVEMKRALLEMEGVSFDAAGRAECPRYHYEGWASRNG